MFAHALAVLAEDFSIEYDQKIRTTSHKFFLAGLFAYKIGDNKIMLPAHVREDISNIQACPSPEERSLVVLRT